jgi:hypothetical protein
MASEDPVYKVHSMVRKVATRLHRQKSASRHRFVQRLAGGDITVRRARPATITRAQLERHLEVLKKAELEGKIEVRTHTGVPVDLKTLKPVPGRLIAKPLAAAPLDSAADDKTFEQGVGEHIPAVVGGKGISEEVEAPESSELPGSDEVPVEGGGDPVETRKAKKKKKKSLFGGKK